MVEKIFKDKKSTLHGLEYNSSYELEDDPYFLSATFLDPNYKSLPFYDSTEKRKFMKTVKKILSDFYAKKRVSELIPDQSKLESSQKKLKLTFEEDVDEDDDSEDGELVVLDLNKEIIAYGKFQINQ